MRHVALAVLLFLSIATQVFAQHTATASNTSASSGASRSEPSYSPPPSSSSPSYSPPASSGGGYHPSGSAPASNSSSAAGSAHPSSGGDAPRSNMKISTTGYEGKSSSRVNAGGEPGSAAPSALRSPSPESGGSRSLPMQALVPYSGNDFSRALKSGQLNSKLLDLGLEPNKNAFIAVTNQGSEAPPKNPSWFSRTFLGKQKKQPQTQLAGLPRPCPVKGCAPPAPKPCVGKNCKQPPPGICHSGAPDGAGGCRPWGYLGRCHSDGVCAAQFAPVDESYCDSLANQIRQLQERAKSQGFDCRTNAQAQVCSEISNLMRQYQMCRMAAHSAFSNVPGTTVVPGGFAWP